MRTRRVAVGGVERDAFSPLPFSLLPPSIGSSGGTDRECFDADGEGKKTDDRSVAPAQTEACAAVNVSLLGRRVCAHAASFARLSNQPAVQKPSFS